MRRRRLKRLWKRLLLLKLGAAKRAYGLVRIQLPAPDEPVTAATFTFTLNRKKPRQVRRRIVEDGLGRGPAGPARSLGGTLDHTAIL